MNISSHLQRISNQVTRRIAVRYASTVPMYPVIEYPKCGGTWVCQMLAGSLALPFAQFSKLPVAMPSVVHGHWKFHPGLENVTFLMRDGRDVMVSYYFHFARHYWNSDEKYDGIFSKRLGKLLGADADLQDIRTHLPVFMEYLFENPTGCRQNWLDYNRSWANRPKVSYIKYEDLRTDCVASMNTLVTSLVGDQINKERVERAVDQFSMKRMTGRNPGEEDKGSFIRKGVVGDWKNHFTKDAGEVFDRLAGEVLIELGYEQDNSWVSRCDPS